MSIFSKLHFLSIKHVPKLIWRSQKALTFQPPIISLLVLIFGLGLFGLGEALLLAAGAGVSPWTTLAEGISILTGWTIGLATFIVSIAVLLTWIPLRLKCCDPPGFSGLGGTQDTKRIIRGQCVGQIAKINQFDDLFRRHIRHQLPERFAGLFGP